MTVTRRQVLITAAASSLVAAASCAEPGGGQTDVGDEADGTVHVVVIEGFEFSPESLDVKVGDTVRFTNLDIVPHTATATDKSWDTGSLATEESASIRVEAGMTGDYFCVFHPNMVAKLVIG
jgi:plastocyanin